MFFGFVVLGQQFHHLVRRVVSPESLCSVLLLEKHILQVINWEVIIFNHEWCKHSYSFTW